MNKTIPQGYKDSALGVIPQEWEVKRLGGIATKIGSGVTPRGGEAVYKVKGHHFIRSQNVGWGHLIIDNVAYIDESTHKKQISTELCIDDVLLNITGASIGRCALVSPRISGGNVNQHVCIIRVDKKYILPFYLSSYLLSEKGQQVIDSYQAGGNRQGLNFEQIKSFVIPIPRLKEQEKITEVLNLWDSAIEKQGALVDALTRRKRALMQQLLTARKRLPNFNEPWNDVELGYILNYEQPTKYIVKDTEYSNKYKTPVLTAGKTFILGYTNEEFGVCEDIPLILFDDFTTASKYIDFPFKVKSSAIKLLRVKSGYNIRFIYEAMQHIKYIIGGHERHWISKYAYITLSVPTLAEQQAIAEVLSTSDQEIELAKKHLDSFRTQKRALMQQLLTGKKRVKLQTN